MIMKTGKKWQHNRQRGASLFIVAGSLVFFLGMAALAIDLASLYVARSEVQRAADAAALAGATVFVTSGCTGGASGVPCSDATVQTQATSAAIAAGNQNMVGGQSPAIVATDVSFNTSNVNNPRITVNVQRTAAHGNAMPTLFAKIFGRTTADVSAIATAEAYNPSGSSSGPPLCVSCLKPVAMPNCDPNHIVSSTDPNANLSCPDPPTGQTATYDSYFINPSTHAIVNPGSAPTGVIGEQWTGHEQIAPSQYQLIDLGGGTPAYTNNITACNANAMTCGYSYPTLQGNKVGPTTASWASLIHQGTTNCNNQPSGQDTITFPPTQVPPYTITGGSNNPNPSLRGVSGITSSDSIVTFPLYSGSLDPGGNTVTIDGFMQVFITQVCHQGTSDDITSYVLNVAGCANNPGACGAGSTGGGGSGSGGTVSGGGASLVPVRLVRQ